MKCPKCGCEEFDFGRFNAEDGDAWRVIICEGCDYKFCAVYQFAFYEDGDTGEMIEVED